MGISTEFRYYIFRESEEVVFDVVFIKSKSYILFQNEYLEVSIQDDIKKRAKHRSDDEVMWIYHKPVPLPFSSLSPLLLPYKFVFEFPQNSHITNHYGVG